jgi:hypothetical protein
VEETDPAGLLSGEHVMYEGGEAWTWPIYLCAAVLVVLISPMTWFGITHYHHRVPGFVFWSLWVLWIIAGLVFLGIMVARTGKRLVVTDRRIIWGSDVFKRSRMRDVRYHYDGGLMQAAHMPIVEWEYDGTTFHRTLQVTDSMAALDAILGGPHKTVGVLGGATRKRSGVDDAAGEEAPETG